MRLTKGCGTIWIPPPYGINRSDCVKQTSGSFRSSLRAYLDRQERSWNSGKDGLAIHALADLQLWRALAQSVDPDYFVFPSENPNKPISRRNIWARRILPRLQKVNLDWATFQCLRKTNATLSRKAGVDAKVSADQRGHGLGVSMEVYTASDRQQKREAVQKLESAVALKRQPKLSEKA